MAFSVLLLKFGVGLDSVNGKPQSLLLWGWNANKCH